MQASFPARLSLHIKRLTLTSIMQPKQSSTFALLLKKLCVSQFKETQKAKPSVLVHSGNASRLTIRTTNEIYLRLISTVYLTFADRSRRCAKDDVSVDSRDPLQEKHSDWEMRTGVKMTTRDVTFDWISFNEKCELAKKSNGQKYLHYTPHECQYLAKTLKLHKQRAAKVLKQNKDTIADTKERARSRSRSSDPQKNGTRK